MTLPVLHLRGTPYEQGLEHGKGLKDRVQHNVAVYFDRFKREVGLSRREVLVQATQFLEAIEAQNGDYYHGMQGIADAIGVPLPEVAALNARYEILYYQFGVLAVADGCTAFAVPPGATADGHLYLGQNWDWIPQVKGAVLHTEEPDGLQTISFTEAGIVGGKIGMNSAGLGLAINGLTSTDDDWSRLYKPFHVRCYEILRQASLPEAAAIVTDTARSCSANFMLAQVPDRTLNIEAAPASHYVSPSVNGCLVHANHFVDPDVLGVVEPPAEKRPNSEFRQARLAGLLSAGRRHTPEDLKRYLKDHEQAPNALCRHEDPEDPPEDHYITVTSVIMDLTAGHIWLSDGPPCEHAYQEYGFYAAEL